MHAAMNFGLPSLHWVNPKLFLTIFTLGALTCAASAVDDLSSNKITQLTGHNSGVKKMVWTPGGKLISGDGKANVFVWDPPKTRDLHNFQAGVGFVRTLDVFDGGRRYLVCVNSAVLIGSVATGRQTEKMSERPGTSFNREAAASPDGKTISVIITGPEIVHYSAATGKETGKIVLPSDGGSLSYTQDGRLVVGSDGGNDVWVYEPNKTKPAFTLAMRDGGRKDDIKPSPDGKWVAALSRGSVQVFQLRSNADPLRIDLGKVHHEAMAWSADSDFIVTGNAEGLVRFWEVRSGKLRKQLQLEIGQSSALAFSPDGHWLAIGGGDYIDMSKAPPRQEIDDKSIRLVEFSASQKSAGPVAIAKPGAASTEVTIRLRTLQEQFEAAAARTGADAYKQQLVTAQKNYLAQLETETASAAKVGNLDLAVALRDEKSLVLKSVQLPALASTAPAELQKLRAAFLDELQTVKKLRLSALQPLYDRFEQTLAGYQEDLTRRQRLEEALEVKDRRDKLAQERTGETSF